MTFSVCLCAGLLSSLLGAQAGQVVAKKKPGSVVKIAVNEAASTSGVLRQRLDALLAKAGPGQLERLESTGAEQLSTADKKFLKALKGAKKLVDYAEKLEAKLTVLNEKLPTDLMADLKAGSFDVSALSQNEQHALKSMKKIRAELSKLGSKKSVWSKKAKEAKVKSKLKPKG